MSPRISWKPRHFAWLIIVIIIAVLVYGRKYFKNSEAPIKDLTRSETMNKSLGTNYINEKIVQKTDGPYPFISAERKKDRIIISFSKGGKPETIELAGIKLPEKTAPELDAIKYLNEFLKDQFIRVQSETLKDRTNMFIFAFNKYSNSPNKVMFNVARNLIANGLVLVVSNKELANSEYKEFLLADSDVAKMKNIGIYKDLKQPKKEGTGN